MPNKIIIVLISSLLISNCSIDTIKYLKKIDGILKEFSISQPLNQKMHFESCNLVTINTLQQSSLKLDSLAAIAFLKMEKHAAKDSIKFRVASAFRTVDRQSKIINRKLKKGIPIESILKENTLPGFSEHHSGKAIDFLSDNSYSLSVEFEKTKTFKWLTQNADKYGFYLSYPKNNKDGIMYEPWHWMYKNE
tara:strand:+ start:4884 stop:5459 length:576 start_codon:yes stop_codon:yes gene_type:complete